MLAENPYKTVAHRVAEQIQQKSGLETRAVVPGHIQRGGSPSPYDRVLSTRFGVHAAELIRDGIFGVSVAMLGDQVIHNPLRDVAGLRVVLTSRQAVYRFAHTLMTCGVAQLDEVHDYIAAPKQSGYRSLHLIFSMPVVLDSQAYLVPVEIQLRTAGMDAWACMEHRLIYKPVT